MSVMAPDPDEHLAREILEECLSDWAPDELRDLRDALAADADEEYPR